MFPSEEEGGGGERKKGRENQSTENYTRTTRPPIRYEYNTGQVESLRLVTDGATHSLTAGPAAEAGGIKSCINSHIVQPVQDGGQPRRRQPCVRSAVGVPRAEQPPRHRADELVLGAVDVGHHAVGVADEGRVVEGSFAHSAQPETRGKSRVKMRAFSPWWFT